MGIVHSEKALGFREDLTQGLFKYSHQSADNCETHEAQTHKATGKQKQAGRLRCIRRIGDLPSDRIARISRTGHRIVTRAVGRTAVARKLEKVKDLDSFTPNRTLEFFSLLFKVIS